MQRMNCEEAKKIDIVDYISSLGFQPKKIKGNDYWFLSPLRNEKEASFKVNRKFNVWYDHGLGKGGNLIDFGLLFYKISVSELLEKFGQNNFSFHQHTGNNSQKDKAAEKEKISIINVQSGITSIPLANYLETRKIPLRIADAFCKEIDFRLYDKEHTAIGFKNNAGGYELRNEYFKGSSSPKYVSYFDNKATKNIKVFEGFFDFLSYKSVFQNAEKQPANFLVLNSLSFFERSLLLMEKHESIYLYLDHDAAGRKCTSLAEKRSVKFQDESKLYQGYKDLNEWGALLGKLQKIRELKHRRGMRL